MAEPYDGRHGWIAYGVEERRVEVRFESEVVAQAPSLSSHPWSRGVALVYQVTQYTVGCALSNGKAMILVLYWCIFTRSVSRCSECPLEKPKRRSCPATRATAQPTRPS